MRAKIKKTLVFYDGPQVMLLEGRHKMHVVAVAIEKEGMEYPFFACEVYKRDWQRYINGKADLFYLYSISPLHNYYFFDLEKAANNEVNLVKAKASEYENSAYWPEGGFFSSNHTEPLTEAETAGNGEQVFDIDGNWETTDFSSFYSKVSDIYGIFFAQQVLREKSDLADVRNLKTSVKSRLWRGGGSYSGFYKTLADALPSLPPLRVRKIQYASPGQIELVGDEDVFDELLDSFGLSIKEFNEAKEASAYINGVLSKSKLKKAKPDAKFSSSAIAKEVKIKSDFVMHKLGITDADEFFEACDGNILIYSKLALSVYRRFKGLHDFMLEGRVSARGAEQREDWN